MNDMILPQKLSLCSRIAVESLRSDKLRYMQKKYVPYFNREG